MGKTMNGIDISGWQEGIDLSKVECDFVIIKVTEGLSYVNKFCAGWFTQAEKLGKCLGFYHFARPEYNDAIKEAQYFYVQARDYFKRGIPVLDWESKGLKDIAWAKRWLDEVYRLSGVKPLVYTSTSVANNYDWSPVAGAGYGLWIAQYRDNQIDRNYDMSKAGPKPSVKHWPSYVMWQWTSSGRLDGYNGNLDCDIFYGDKDTWNEYAGKKKSTVEKDPPSKLKIDGKIQEKSVKRLQWWLGTTRDGEISGQNEADKSNIPAMAAACTWTGRGSLCIKALQNFLTKKGYNVGTIDGLCGKKTVTGLQKYLKAEGYDPGTIDGILGPKTAKALQRFLNSRISTIR